MGETEAFGHEAACEPDEVEGEEGEIPVHAAISKLTPGTTYFYKLLAKNLENGQENLGEGEAVQSVRTLGPHYGTPSVSDVSSSSATVATAVDPDEAPTSVVFEYGACPSIAACPAAGFEHSSPVEAMGAGDTPVTVEPHIQGLKPGTAYHYRAVASSEIASGDTKAFPGPEGTFTTQAAGGTAGLIDGRGWELVSPADKDGADIQGPGEPWGITQAAADGHAMTYLTSTPTEDGLAGYSNAQQVLSTRGPGGWSSVDLASPHDEAVSGSVNAGQEYRFFNEDLTQGVLQPFGAFQPCQNGEGVAQPCFSPEASEQTAFVR